MTMEWTNYLKAAYRKAVLDQLSSHARTTYLSQAGQSPLETIISVDVPYKHRVVPQEEVVAVLQELNALLEAADKALLGYELKEKKDELPPAQPKGKQKKGDEGAAEEGSPAAPKRPVRRST